MTSPFTFNEGNDGYMKTIEMRDSKKQRLCLITQSIGHCCAASTIGALTSYGFWNVKKNVDSFIKEMKSLWKTESVFRSPEGKNLSLFNISGFYVFLSQETITFDKALRTHPDIKLIQTFVNRRGGPDSQGNTISLYFMEF